MNNIGFEVRPTDRSPLQKLWTIVKFCFGLALLGIWLVATPLALVAYHGDAIEIGTQAIPAEWGVIGTAGFFWLAWVWPLLRSFRK